MVNKFTTQPTIKEVVPKINEVIDAMGTVKKVNNTSPDSNGNVSLTIPTVNNGTLTIQKNGATVKTFTANSSSNVTCNITVPTNTNELTNGAGFITGIGSADVINALGYTPYSSSNPNGYTSNIGTITGIKMNGSSKGTSGVVDLGTVITAHQDISGKQDKITSTNKLSADLVQDGTTNKTVTATEKSTWNNKLDSSAISDMATKTWVGQQGYTSNVGTVTKVNNTSPDSNGNVTLSTPTVDQTYNASSSNAQSGVAIAGAKFMQNKATGTNSLTISGTATTATSAVNIGATSTAGGGYSVALGYYAASNGARSTSIGYGARIGASTADAIQIGNGTNSTAKSLSVGFYNTANYQLLDGTTGLIPLDRISTMTGAGASTTGAKGLVPAPASGDNAKFLRGDGTWQTVSSGGSGANIDLSNLSATGEAHFLKSQDISDVVKQQSSGTVSLMCWKYSGGTDYVYTVSNTVGSHILNSNGGSVVTVTNNEIIGYISSVLSSGILVSYYYADINYSTTYGSFTATRYSAGDITIPVNNLTDNNANILNIQKSDGQWIGKDLTISDATAKGTYRLNLYSYLPDDSYNYEVYVWAHVYQSASTYSSGHMITSILGCGAAQDGVAGIRIWNVGTNCRQGIVNTTVPVGTDRQIILTITGNSITNYTGIRLAGYRRLGTNI